MNAQSKNPEATAINRPDPNQVTFPFGTNDSWDVFLENNSGRLTKIHSSLEAEDNQPTEQPAIYKYFLDQIFTSLSPFERAKDTDVNSDLLAVKKAVTGIMEVQRQKVLTKSEASALLEFVISKFVERRFDDYMKAVLHHHTSVGYWTIHGLEAFNRERRA